jgi:hypothetical protein
LDEDGRCEKCVQKAYNKAHACHCCGNLYGGALIYVGKNAAGIESRYCPKCALKDLSHELELADQCKEDDEAFNAHIGVVLEIMKRVEEELERSGL